CRISCAGGVYRSGIALSRALEVSTAQKSQHPTRGNSPPPGKCRILRAGEVHRSGIAEFHALEPSTAQKLQTLTRGRRPPVTHHKLPRAVPGHRPRIANSHAQERSTAQESRNLTRGNGSSLGKLQNSTRGKCPPPKYRTFPRAGKIYHLQNIFF